MYRVLLVAGLLIFALSSVVSQSDEWYFGVPIVDVQFEGLENVKPSELEGLRAQIIGQEFSEAVFLDLQGKLFSLNYFETFEASVLPGDSDNGSVIVKFNVVERPLVANVVFRGNNKIQEADLRDAVITKSSDILSDTRIRIDADAIRAVYREEGFSGIQVDVSTDKIDGENQVDVVFTIVEGDQAKVSEILFSGNSFASTATLKRLLTSKEQRFLVKGIFIEANLEEDRKALTTYYRERGFIDAVVVDIVKIIKQGDEGQSMITLTYFIEEGEQYLFGGISFEGNTLFTDEELMEQVRSKDGKILNKTRMDADLFRIGDVYYNEGYIFNQIAPEEVRDENNRTISYLVRIKEEGQAHIENISIRGNVKTKDYVILRELPLTVGEVFSKEKILAGLNNLANLRYFDSFIPETPQGSAPGLMDLVINVEESRTTDIGFGITLTMESVGFPVVGFVRWADKNFLGTGQELGVNLSASNTKQELRLEYVNGWLFGRRWSGGLELSVSHNLVTNVLQDFISPVYYDTSSGSTQVVPDPYDGHWVDKETGVAVANPTSKQISDGSVVTDYSYASSKGQAIDPAYLMNYNSFQFSLGGSTGRTFHTPIGRIGISTGANVGLTYTIVDELLYRPFDQNIRNEMNRWRFINRLWLRVAYDTRDITYNPSKGYFLSQSLTYTGGILFGTRHHNRTTSVAEAYFTLFDVPVGDSWNFKGVLALHSSFSAILPQFFRDDDGEWGSDTVATTTDLLYTDGMVVAKGWPLKRDGKLLWNSWIELRMPIVPGYISFNSFFSGAALYTELDDIKAMEIGDFNFSFGGGLQLELPTFPLGIYLVKRFRLPDWKMEWQAGELMKIGGQPDSGVDFVISFTFSYF